MKVVITGSGPAGCACGVALAKRGIDVALLTGPQRRPWLEGLSQRTGEALESAGCREAAALLRDPAVWVDRYVSWGNLRGETNREGLVDRTALDDALRRDAREAGVRLIDDALLDAKRVAGNRSWRFRSASGQTIGADYWIDARGRAAPRGRRRERGPSTLAVNVEARVQGAPALASALVATRSGFSWIVTRGEDARVQWFRDPPKRGARIAPGRDTHSLLISEIRREIAALRDAEGPTWLASLSCPDTRKPSKFRARDATSFLSESAVGTRFLRVGDAAASSDPLSGQGVFRALAMARAATACFCTQTECPERAELATRFYRERVSAMFWRDWRKGLDFYREELRWPEAPFWKQRRALHAGPWSGPLRPRIETRPIVLDGLVENASVLTTPAHPDGVWSYEGVPVVSLLESAVAAPEVLARRFEVGLNQMERALGWLGAQGLGPSAIEGKPIERLTASHPIPHSASHG